MHFNHFLVKVILFSRTFWKLNLIVPRFCRFAIDTLRLLLLFVLCSLSSDGSRIHRGWGSTNPGRGNLLFGIIFAENCIKIKEIRPRGGSRRNLYYIDPPLLSAIMQSLFLHIRIMLQVFYLTPSGSNFVNYFWCFCYNVNAAMMDLVGTPIFQATSELFRSL